MKDSVNNTVASSNNADTLPSPSPQLKPDGAASTSVTPSRAPPALVAAAVASKKVEKSTAEMAEKWNTKNLGLRLAADACSAFTAAGIVAPIISIIDKSIMENASGRAPFRDSLLASLRTLVLRPHHILAGKPFLLITMLYGGTYFTANTLDTMTSTLHPTLPPSHVTSGTAKFASSSLANISLCIYKDQHFVRMFGPPGAAAAQRAVPAATYALFAARDCLTIFASFNVPPLLGPVLSKRLGKDIEKHVSGQTVAQFAAPAAVQLVSTPLHLLGLDLYNRPKGTEGPGWKQRWEQVRQGWAVSSAARICRIMPAFGVGGVVNTKMRGSFMAKLG